MRSDLPRATAPAWERGEDTAVATVFGACAVEWGVAFEDGEADWGAHLWVGTGLGVMGCSVEVYD
jgi:hypothetical protein